jgi:hypothetical protein
MTGANPRLPNEHRQDLGHGPAWVVAQFINRRSGMRLCMPGRRFMCGGSALPWHRDP